jgi:hypothetical protein
VRVRSGRAAQLAGRVVQAPLGVLPAISSTSPLIERDRELSLSQDLLGANGSAGSGAAVIEGPAGIGKSRLAQALYVTPETAEVHLSNAYRKLSIRARQQLAMALSA